MCGFFAKKGAFIHTIAVSFQQIRVINVPSRSLPLECSLQITGQALSARTFGKPNPEPYRLIENILIEQANALDLPMSAPNNRPDGENGVSPSPFTSIFAVGDNPAADVRGARAAGHPWVSILVRTGVFNDSKNCRVDPAHIVVNDVNAAVDAAIHYSRSLKWHSMR